MKRNSYVRATLLIALLCSSLPANSMYSHHSSHSSQNNSGDNIVAIILTVAGAAAAGYGLYKFCEWLSTPSNETIINEARKALEDTNKHHELITYIAQNQNALEQANEQILDQLATQCNISHANSELVNISATKNSAAHSLTKVQQRIDLLYSKHDTDHYARTTLETQRDALQNSIRSLELAHRTINAHATYFDIRTMQIHLIQRHNEILQTTSYNPRSIEFDIAFKTAVANSSAAKSAYQYADLADILDGDIKNLDSIIRNSHKYPHITYQLQDLTVRLKTFKNRIVIDNRYTQDIQAREENRLQQQRLEIERAKARAEEEQARAAREKNRLKEIELLQKQTELQQKERELREQKKQTEVLKEQLNQQKPYHRPNQAPVSSAPY